jgi:hypothetical protein
VEEQRALTLEPLSLSIFPNPMRENILIKFQISNNKCQMNVKDKIHPHPYPPPSRGRIKEGGKSKNYVQSSKPEGLPYIRIFNAAGRLVKQFNYLSATQYGGVQPFNHVIWDGSDNAGRLVPAGVYFVQVEVRWAGEDRKSGFVKVIPFF